MKQFLIAASLVVLGVAAAQAENFGVPRGQPGALETADYGGVAISSSFASSANVRALEGAGVISWIHVSSAQHLTGGDFFIIRSTDSLVAGAVSGDNEPTDDYSVTNEVYRHYTSSADISGGLLGTPTFGYTVRFDPPLRLPTGGTVKFNSTRQGLVTIGAQKFE